MAVQIVVGLAVVLAGLGFVLLTATLIRRRAPLAAGPSGVRVVSSPEPRAEPMPAPPAVAAPVLESAEVQVNRRIFLNRAWLLAMSVFGVAFGGTTLAFMWPNSLGGFGSKITLGKKKSEILAQIKADKQPAYFPEGRFYIVPYDTSDKNNAYVKEGGAKDGIMTLYQKCAHLGCRVPFCVSSQWFECPCHGSKYNLAGEVQPGSPAPAGLFRFPIELDGETITVDTSQPVAQPAKGVDTIKQPPAGAHCQ
jgi:cytochrome b6-f complex iron-sulfur subunit